MTPEQTRRVLAVLEQPEDPHRVASRVLIAELLAALEDTAAAFCAGICHNKAPHHLCCEGAREVIKAAKGEPCPK